MKTAAILLAGGVGSRMQSATPKQFLKLQGKLIALYSFELFACMKEIEEIIVVCSPIYRHHFSEPECAHLRFALP